MCHVIVNRSWRNDVRDISPNVHFNNLTNRWWWWGMIRRWQSISTVHRINVLLTSMTLWNQDRGLCLYVQVRCTMEISVEIGTATQATEETYSRVRLQMRTSINQSVRFGIFFIFFFIFLGVLPPFIYTIIQWNEFLCKLAVNILFTECKEYVYSSTR